MNSGKSRYEEIARVAYGLYEKRGCGNGDDFADWVEAEKIVMKKYGKASGGEGKGSKSAPQLKIAKKQN